MGLQARRLLQREAPTEDGGFSECFGRGIRTFGDVDGIVERLGHFLLMEWKEGETLGVGQKKVHDALLALP